MTSTPTSRSISRCRRLLGIVVLGSAATFLWWLWPARLGGDTTIVIVEGHSMEPTYHPGDLIIARHEDRYDPGDVVVFQIPIPGRSRRALVIHRLLQVGDDGRITTQGDNRANPDEFQLTVNDIVGRADLRIREGGTILLFGSRWWILAILSGVLVTVALWPPRPSNPNGLQPTPWPPNPLIPTTFSALCASSPSPWTTSSIPSPPIGKEPDP